MENLKNYIREHFNFDLTDEPTKRNFEAQLNSNLDNKLIYFSDCKAFYSIDPAKVVELAKQSLETIDARDDLDYITIVAREAMQNLVYNYMYGELEKAYLKANKRIPQKLAEKLANLHNLVMEIQEDLNAFDYSNRDELSYDYDDIEDIDEEILSDEIAEISETIDQLEADTSDLDCKYNNYEF